jgi:Ca-activated chloride channel family protein
MEFFSPGRLSLLLLVPVMLAVYLAALRRRAQYAHRFSELGVPGGVTSRGRQWRRHATVALALLAVSSCVVAFAQPKGKVQVPRERATVVVVIDVSLSMMATDVDPNRLAAAKEAAKEFVAQLPAKFNVCLLSFSGTPSIVVPPTIDRAIVQQSIGGLELAESTASGEAIFASLQALTQVPPDPEHPADPAPARIVFLSDGKRTTGRLVQDAAEAAKEQKTPVYTITFGTDAGSFELDGVRQLVPPDRAEMRELSETTGGQAYTAESAGELKDVYKDIGSSVGFETVDREITDRFAGIAMLLALAAAAATAALGVRFP